MDGINDDEDNGNYDDTIVAIAIGTHSDIDMDDDGSDIDAALDDMLANPDEVDREETWLRRCVGDLPDEMGVDSPRFASLPAGVQIKLVLELRDREKATLLENLRECGSRVEKLKQQLYASEDRRMELEHDLDTENQEIAEMKREFQGMKVTFNAHVSETQRIRKELLVQRDRLSRTIELQKQQEQPTQAVEEQQQLSSADSTGGPDSISAIGLPQLIDNQGASRTKSKIAIEFERKLETNPRYREEFERFKEFQDYYQEMKQNLDPKDGNTKNLNEDYRKMLEFQLGYERLLFTNNQTT